MTETEHIQTINIPQTTTRELSDSERFIVGLRKLAEVCNLQSTVYTPLGINTIKFQDGSSIGCLRLFIDAGIISGNFKK